jgi:hypothetical protein
VWRSEPCRAWRVWQSPDLTHWTPGPVISNSLPDLHTIVWHPVVLHGPAAFYRVQALP